MGLLFAPMANVVLSAVRPEEEGKAPRANNAIRERAVHASLPNDRGRLSGLRVRPLVVTRWAHQPTG
jgi:hypothetical protein